MYHTSASMRSAKFSTSVVAETWSASCACWTERSRSADLRGHLPQGGYGHASSATGLFFGSSPGCLLAYVFLYRRCLGDLMTCSMSVVGWHLAIVKLCVYGRQLLSSLFSRVQQVETYLCGHEFATRNLRQRFNLQVTGVTSMIVYEW